MCTGFYEETSLSEGYAIAHAFCSLILSLVGTVGNSMSVFLILRGRLHENSHAMKLLVELCLTNLVTTSFILPLVGVNSLHRAGWVYGHTFCKLFGYVLYVTITSELGILMMVTVNQYLVIVRYNKPSTWSPSNYYTFKLLIILSAPWAFSLTVYLFPLTDTWDTIGFDSRKGFCTLRNRSGIWSIKPILSLSCILVTTVIIVFCYANIYWTQHVSRRKIIDASILNPEASRATTSKTTPSAAITSNRQNWQLIRMITVILINFFGTYFPFLVLMIADPCLDTTPLWVYTVILYLSWSNTATNPIIYALLHTQIQAQWRRLLMPCRLKRAQRNTLSSTTRRTATTAANTVEKQNAH